MTPQRLRKWGFFTAGAVCLAAGYSMVGLWGLLPLAGLAWSAGVIAAGWSSGVFVVFVGMAAAGVHMGAWPPLMIIGASFALVGWDLASWEDFVAGDLPAKTVAWIEGRHYAYLGLAVGAGLLVALVGRLISYSLPFGVILVLAALELVGLYQVWRLVRG
jgi:hypothetical protein